MARFKLINFLMSLLKAILVVSMTLMLLVSGCVWWMSKGVFSTSNFDSKIWFAKHTDVDDFSCYRGGMAFDIRDNLIKNGMTMKKVELILGVPDSIHNNKYMYILGMCSGIGIDFDSLNIDFSNGVITNSYIQQH